MGCHSCRWRGAPLPREAAPNARCTASAASCKESSPRAPQAAALRPSPSSRRRACRSRTVSSLRRQRRRRRPQRRRQQAAPRRWPPPPQQRHPLRSSPLGPRRPGDSTARRSRRRRRPWAKRCRGCLRTGRRRTLPEAGPRGGCRCRQPPCGRRLAGPQPPGCPVSAAGQNGAQRNELIQATMSGRRIVRGQGLRGRRC